MKNKLFNRNSLSLYDKTSAIVYLCLTVMISTINFWFNDIETQKSIVLAYSFLTPFVIYVLNYKSLRNIKMIIIWLVFAVIHLPIYQYLIENNHLMFERGHAAHGLQYTLLFIILFQILRIAHLKLFGYELVSLNRGTGTDLWDNRKIRFPDIVCFFIYFPIWIVLSMYK